MSSDAQALRKKLKRQGYRVEAPTRRGSAYYEVFDPRRDDAYVGSFPVSPSSGSWHANFIASVRRYERTGIAGRRGAFQRG